MNKRQEISAIIFNFRSVVLLQTSASRYHIRNQRSRKPPSNEILTIQQFYYVGKTLSIEFPIRNYKILLTLGKSTE